MTTRLWKILFAVHLTMFLTSANVYAENTTKQQTNLQKNISKHKKTLKNSRSVSDKLRKKVINAEKKAQCDFQRTT